MTNDPVTTPRDLRMRQAITEIEGLITSRYPGTTFVITRSADPHGIRVLATVDVDDIAEVLDLYNDGRLVQRLRLHMRTG